MEDNHCISELLWERERRSVLLAVADGIGGRSHGAAASALALRIVEEKLRRASQAKSREHNLRELLQEAVMAAHRGIRLFAERKSLDPGMGTTLTVAFVRWPGLYIAHVGDSRCYLYRRGRLRCLTQDHTLAARLLREGLTEEAPASWTNSVLHNAVTGETPPKVEMHHLCLCRGDTLLLCTDGLTGPVHEDTLAAILSQRQDPGSTCEALVERAVMQGGSDNITAVVAQL